MKSFYDELLEKCYGEMVECRNSILDVREENNYRITDEELLLLLRLEHIVNHYVTINEMKNKEV